MTTKFENYSKLVPEWAKEILVDCELDDTHITALELYKCSLPPPSHLTQAWTNGNIITPKLYNYTIIIYLQYYLLQSLQYYNSSRSFIMFH